MGHPPPATLPLPRQAHQLPVVLGGDEEIEGLERLHLGLRRGAEALRSRAMIRPTLLCLALAGCATTSGPAFYPLEELRALDTPETKDELLAHAREVAPSKRNDEWRGLVERAAVATLSGVEVKDTASAGDALGRVEELDRRFPALRKSALFLSRRAAVGVSAFGWMLQSSRSQEWTALVLDFATHDAVTPHLAQRLAEEVVMKRLIPSTARPLYELALERDGAAVCEAPGLIKVAMELMSDGDTFPAASKACWKQLEGPLVEAVKASETRTAKLKLCAAMVDHRDVAAVKAACPD